MEHYYYQGTLYYNYKYAPKEAVKVTDPPSDLHTHFGKKYKIDDQGNVTIKEEYDEMAQLALKNIEFGKKIIEEAAAEFYSSDDTIADMVSSKFVEIRIELLTGNIRAARNKLQNEPTDLLLTQEIKDKYLKKLNDYLS